MHMKAERERLKNESREARQAVSNAAGEDIWQDYSTDSDAGEELMSWREDPVYTSDEGLDFALRAAGQLPPKTVYHPPANFEVQYSQTDVSVMATSPNYIAFGAECKYWLRTNGLMGKQPKTAEDKAKRVRLMHQTLLNIVEYSTQLPMHVRADLQRGTFTYGHATDLNNNPILDADGTPKIMKHKVAPELETWRQRRRWLWDALEDVVEGFCENASTSIQDEVRHAKNVEKRWPYFERRKGREFHNPPREEHPWLIDPPCIDKKQQPIVKRKLPATPKAKRPRRQRNPNA